LTLSFANSGAAAAKVDGDDVTQLHRPKFGKWFLLVESWRRRSLRLSGRRRAAAERDFKAERLSSLEVDHKLVLGW
jgi:hypothetical protein